MGAGANPAGAGNGGGAPEFDDQCPLPNKEQSQESSTHHYDFTQKSKIKKKRNQHLNQQIEVNGENFEFERDQFRINLREFASRPNLEVYSNYPINKGIGRAYLDPDTNLFVGIDENGTIRKAGNPLLPLLFASALIGDRVTIAQIIAILIDWRILPEFL